ncbi:nucleoside phosphorylase domain-containing protein [Colletotrichum navitas]|uniref:Nucleoside phosphorylase domain-containing protein n=1 Tax=Colletotrichum navitas TaxID=681940 RepID=A0AAD8PUT3_9PEZI|nr:nucleoside phosphorylase domain-containing protein [Colletotrichum navitas]KAK1585011.1 nucleoside phosphorylase domain-containing protein [Colletotrichum navitas]
MPSCKRRQLGQEARPKLAYHEYTVGWICAIPTEYAAAQALLDEEHAYPHDLHPNSSDRNYYAFGRIGSHDVVMTVLAEMGIAAAATTAANMERTFPNIGIRLMVGIGGGAPTRNNDIRLGDVVVSTVHNGKSSVFQYDFGKDIQGQSFQQIGVLDQPPQRLRAAAVGLRARHMRDGHKIEETINGLLHNKPSLRSHFARPSSDSDKLYKSTFVHPGNSTETCAAACRHDPSNLVERSPRNGDKLVVHYGTIASANQVMKNAETRDKLAAKYHVLCLEMEAAGLSNYFPCLVVRGICDYSDSHKNKEWQGYAAMTAATYVKDLLYELTPLCSSSPVLTSTEFQDPKAAADRERLSDEQWEKLLNSLRFDQIDARQMTIKKAHSKTCK